MMDPKEQKGKRKELPTPTTPLLLSWDSMELDIAKEEKGTTRRKSHEIIQKVSPATGHGYLRQLPESQEQSFEEMFQILQRSLVQAFRDKFQMAGVDLNVVQNKQIATEARMELVRNEINHIVLGI